MVTATSVSPADGASFGISKNSSFKKALSRLHDPSALANLFYHRQFGSVNFKIDDFDEVTFNGDPWTVTKDTNAVTWAINVQENGVLRGSTGTTDTDGLSLLGPAIYKGDRNCGMQIRFKIDVVTNYEFEVGWINDVTDKTQPSVTDIDTPAFGAGLTEGAVVHIDTTQTLTTMALVMDSATYTTASKKNLFTRAINGTTGVAPAAATFMTIRVQLEGDTVHAMVWVDTSTAKNVLVSQVVSAPTTSILGGIEGGTLVAPWVAIATRNTTAKLLDIDYIARWQDRVA